MLERDHFLAQQAAITRAKEAIDQGKGEDAVVASKQLLAVQKIQGYTSQVLSELNVPDIQPVQTQSENQFLVKGKELAVNDLTFLDIPQGVAIKAWREHRGLLLTELAQRSGMSKGYISELEHGKIAQPDRQRLEQLASALDTSALILFLRVMPIDIKEANEDHTK